MQCPRCSTENPDQANFCLNCGARLTLNCPECGTELPPHARFCFSCGAQVMASPGEPDSAAARALKRLTPREFAERLLAMRGQTSRERRVVTMLFSDVKGSTSMAEKLDPEEYIEIMDGALDVLIEPITRYEGALAHMMGDGILAFFGAPIAHEDDAERACRAALDIIAGAEEYAAQLEEERGISGFNVRVGIHTGLVVVGEVGSDLRVAYTAMGDAVNLASRMEGLAEPGTVLITEDTHRLIAPLFDTEVLGPIQVRGRTGQVSTYRILALRADVGKPRGIVGLESPLVGREVELGALRGTLERLQAGMGGIVTEVGEAGVGKSRLVAELRKEAEPLGLQWVEGRCLSYGTSVPYLLWLDVLRALLGVTVEDSPVSVQQVLRERVQRLCPNSFESVYPYLARLMSLPLDAQEEALLQGVMSERLKANTFQAAETLLECSVSDGPLAVVCEDLHWADPTSIELLEHLFGLSDRASLLLVCVFRPYREHACWQVREMAARLYHHRHTDLWLEPLTKTESETLVGNLLRIETLPPRLRERILDHAEGNPFYVEEVIRSLINSEIIVYDETKEQWQAKRRVEDFTIPDTLQGVLMARIDRLEEETRRVLQLASVIGRIFFYRVLAAIAAEESDLDVHLSTLQREEMIRERTRVPELEYIFKHHLTQEAAYNGLLRRQRQLFHRQVAEALERLSFDRIEERVDLLAYHWERAEERDKATDYLVRAGDRAHRLHANREAVGYYQKALDALVHLPDTVEMRRRRVDTLVNLVASAWRSDPPEENLTRLAEAERLARELPGPDGMPGGDRLRLARIYLWMGRIHYVRGVLHEAIGYYQRVLPVAQESGDAELLAIPSSAIGQAMAIQGYYGKSKALLAQAIPLFGQTGNWTEWVRATSFHGVALAMMGKCDAGMTETHSALARAREMDSPAEIAMSNFHLIIIYLFSGNLALAIEAGLQTVQMAERSGDRMYIYLGQGFRGWAQSRAGYLEAAEASMARSQAAAQELGRSLQLADWFAVANAEIAFRMGRVEEALFLAEQAIDIAQEMRGIFAEGLARRVWGQALAVLTPPCWDEAEAQLAESLRLLQSGESWLAVARTHVAWGIVCRDRGDMDAAREHWDKAAAQWAESKLPWELEKMQMLMGTLQT